MSENKRRESFPIPLMTSHNPDAKTHRYVVNNEIWIRVLLTTYLGQILTN